MTVEDWVRRCVSVRREVEPDRMQMPDVIVALADQRAELVALLRRARPLIDSTWHTGDDIDALLARLGVTP